MTRPKDNLDVLLVEDVKPLAGTGSCFGEDRGPNLSPSELRERQDQQGLHSEVDWHVTWGNISTSAVRCRQSFKFTKTIHSQTTIV